MRSYSMLDNSDPVGGVVGIYGADSGVSPSGASSSSNASRSACTSLVNDVQNGLATYLRMDGAAPDPAGCFSTGSESVACVSDDDDDGALPMSPLRLSTRLSSFAMRFLSSLSTPRLPACLALCLRVLAAHVKPDLVHCPHGNVRSHLIFLRWQA